MDEHEKWELLMASIREAARKSNTDLTEADMPEYLNWKAGVDLKEKLWAKVRAWQKGKGKMDNPVDLSKIRGELVRLQTDLDGQMDWAEAGFRQSIEGTIIQMKLCNLKTALDQYDMVAILGDILRRGTSSGSIEEDITSRVNNIEDKLKDLMVEIATEICGCKESPTDKGL